MVRMRRMSFIPGEEEEAELALPSCGWGISGACGSKEKSRGYQQRKVTQKILSRRCSAAPPLLSHHHNLFQIFSAHPRNFSVKK